MPTPGATRRNFVPSGWTPFPPTRNCVCADRGGHTATPAQSSVLICCLPILYRPHSLVDFPPSEQGIFLRSRWPGRPPGCPHQPRASMTAPNSRERILPRLIEEEMQQSFINYSMSVIVSRALPDVRDGLKPVHRRILYAMNELGLVPGPAVQEVARRWSATCSASTTRTATRRCTTRWCAWCRTSRCAIRWSTARATSARSTATPRRPIATPRRGSRRIAMTMLEDIDKNTVDFQPNFDDRLQEPTVLPVQDPEPARQRLQRHRRRHGHQHPAAQPARGGQGGRDCWSTIPTPPSRTCRKAIKGPDFPTGGYIYGREGIKEAYETGRGRVVMRARAQIEEKESSDKSQIVVTEIPYQVNKANLVRAIAELAMDKKIEGISDVRDESDRDGMRIVIELKRDAIPNVVLNQLYKHTTMQSTFGVIMLALVNGVPEGDEPEGAARALHRAPARDHRPAHAVRPRRGAGPRAHPRGPQDRRRQHRRGDQDHPRRSADTPEADARAAQAVQASARSRATRSSTCASPSSPASRSRSSRRS